MTNAPPANRRYRLPVLVVSLLMAPVFVVVGHRAYQRWQHDQAVAGAFASLVTRPHRTLLARLSYPAAAGYRPHAPCNAADCAPAFSHAVLARLERAGDVHGLATAYILSGDQQRAAALLDNLPPSADRESDRAALLSLSSGRSADALEAADRALAMAPGHPGAVWNRAVLLESLGLPRAAAQAFRRLEKVGEAGWAAEAGQRAHRLELARAKWTATDQRALAEAENIGRGVMPSAEVIASHPDLVRLYLFGAIRESSSAQMDRALRPIAEAIDRASGTTSLAGLVGRSAFMREMVALRRQTAPGSLEKYRRMATETGDPWLLIRAEQFHGETLTRQREPDQAVAVLTRAISQCQRRQFPRLCIEMKIWIAYLENERRNIQAAKRWATEAKKESQTWVLPPQEALANIQLAVAEDFRERFSLARGYAEELAAEPDCVPANMGHEIQAKLDVTEGNEDRARQELGRVVPCPAGPPQLSLYGLEALVELVADGSRPWPDGQSWLERELPRQRSVIGDADPLEKLALDLFEGRATLGKNRPGARAQLERVALAAEAGAGRDHLAEMLRTEAVSALAIDAGVHGEFSQALQRLEIAQGLTARRPCLLGVAVLGSRLVETARTRAGKVVGLSGSLSTVDRLRHRFEVSPSTLAALEGCEEVGVVATSPVLGRSRLLPGKLAWGYLRGDGLAPTIHKPINRLVIFDARPPARLGLSPLLTSPSLAATAEGETVEPLRGAAATPRAALARAMAADVIEWHVHGLLDPEVSDAAALALSPELDPAGQEGTSLLTAADILAVKLPRRPGVILGACHAGLSARYGAYQWSLPLAFLRAGARWVIASPTPIEDVEAPAFFASVWRRIMAGAPPAVALRDERNQARWQRSYKDWIADVVIFN
jgi:cellulose synthase operon protein C